MSLLSALLPPVSWLTLLLSGGVLAPLTGCQPDTPPMVKQPAYPSVHPDAVFRMEFEHNLGSFSPGSGFVGRLPDGSIVGLTAHHLFSPAGGLERELTAAEVPRFVLKILPTGLAGKKLSGLGPMRALPGSQITVNREDWSSDLAAFHADPDWAARALPLAAADAALGDTAFLVVVPHNAVPAVPGDSTDAPDARYLKVQVSLSTPTLLLYKFDAREVDSRGTSGAPIVDIHGNVLAMNMAEASDGLAIWGSGHPSSSMLRRLKGVGP